MKAAKIMLRTISWILMTVMVVVLFSNTYLLIARKITHNPSATVFGYTAAVVLTGSMADAILPNDMVITHSQKDYAVNDIVTYTGNTSTVTHRIIEVKENGYITKGDANNTDDGEIAGERVVGKVILIIPGVGSVILFFQSPLGMLILVLGVFLLIELPSLTKRKKD